jgi:ornithine carbamoyltransferase
VGDVELNSSKPVAEQKRSSLRGRAIINRFFESSTRTRTSFEVAGKRLGGDYSVLMPNVALRCAVRSRFQKVGSAGSHCTIYTYIVAD